LVLAVTIGFVGDFEDLYRRSVRWAAKHGTDAPPSGYLANVPRPNADVAADSPAI